MAIGGFIITGQENKEIVIRAVGPSLESAGVTGAMADPMIELYDATGAVLAWSGDSQAQRAELEAAGLPMADAREAALTTSLPPGAYTVVLSGEDGGTGVALFELYDRNPNGSRIAAISTRGTVGGGEDVVIGGFILGGDQPTQVVVRAIGASLTPLGAANALADPYLEVYDGEGSLMFANDDWRTDQEQQLIECLLPPQDEHESAIIATLRPGNYSAVVRGVGGTSGVALVEVYNLTP
ncbi:MAG: hypothetical protein M3372_07760 [Verrucomicrobiota bacterium]|nr:hypothetical protein [Verrucomicrobiota bacterium]